MTSPSVPIADDCHALIQELDLGPADGLRVVVKDCIDIAGTVTGCGSAALRGAPAAGAHAQVVRDLLDAGCRITGKAQMHELAYGMTGVNPACGTPVNPRWPERIPGGSSSGSAVAVASGICDFAVGTDTGGSVRQPAICCGVYGIKPTFGRVDRAGCHPAESSLDCIGVMARSAQMLIRAMGAIDPGFAPRTLTHAPRLARIRSELNRDVGDRLLYGLMEGLPALPPVPVAGMDEAFAAGMFIIGAETARAHGHLLDGDHSLGGDIRARLTAARAITRDQIAQAEQVRTRFTAAVDAALADVDALVTPALPEIPPTLAQADDPAHILPLTRFLRPFNLSGHPAIVLPVATGPGEGPIGIQIVGRHGDDALLCAIAEWLAGTCQAFQMPPIQRKDTA